MAHPRLGLPPTPGSQSGANDDLPDVPGSGAGAVPEAPFYIPLTGPASRPRHALKHDDTFAVFDSHGDVGATAGGADGLFDRDTRFLSHLELIINGAQPLLLASAVKDDNLNFYAELTNPDIYADDRLILRKDTVHIGRTVFLHDGSLRERMAVTNHGSEPVEFTVSLTFACDFADIFEVRGIRRARRGRAWTEVMGPATVALRYLGLDDTQRETFLCFEPAPMRLSGSIASYQLKLDPGVKRSVFVTAATRGQVAASTRSFFLGLLDRRREIRSAARATASVETSNKLVNEVLCRSMADLRMLTTATPEGPYPYAGIPWYSATFGRDGIIAALQMLWADPSLAAGVLRRLARLQAEADDATSDSNPGKILHESRSGEMAALREVPFGRYYGSVDATPLFVLLAGCYARRSGDYDLIRDLWPAIDRALAWIDGAADVDGDGFVEYARGSETGLANQGWKDSHDAVFHADGRLAKGPIALVEVQAYVYAAKQMAASCARHLGMTGRAAELEEQARVLRQRFEDAFWCPDIGTYALALDGSKAPCKVRTSNAGHALFAGIAGWDRGREVANGLLKRSFYSGWGIRTVAEGEPRYNPMSYHNGSVWPHDNALIADGLSRYGFKGAIGTVFEDLMLAATYMDHRRIPELFCGFRRRQGRGPTLYQTACSPQAWAAGAPFFLLQAMLGLEFDKDACQVRLVNPVVPACTGNITIRNLPLGKARADFVLRSGRNGAVSVQVLRTLGDVQVSMVS